MKITLWWLINISLLTALFVGIVVGVDGARNLALFWVWLTIIMLVIAIIGGMSIDHSNQEVYSPAKKPWMAWVNLVAVVGLLAWGGYIFTAIIYMAAVIILKTIRETQQENRHDD